MTHEVPHADCIVAVTGHRDSVLEPGDDVRHKVQRILEKLAAKHGGAEHLLMLNALAIGADRLVFDVACELHIPTMAVLPMPLADYEKDFTEGEERDGLHRRLAKCAHLWQPETALPRPQCYAALGATLVRHAHILLALWDGLEDDALGGTADVVCMAKSPVALHTGICFPFDIVAGVELVHIDVKREGAGIQQE